MHTRCDDDAGEKHSTMVWVECASTGSESTGMAGNTMERYRRSWTRDAAPRVVSPDQRKERPEKPDKTGLPCEICETVTGADDLTLVHGAFMCRVCSKRQRMLGRVGT